MLQRGCAMQPMLRVIEYFAKPLKVIRNDTIWQIAYELLALVCIIYEIKQNNDRKSRFFSYPACIRRSR